MTNIYSDLFLIILTVLAEACMLWILWNFIKASRRR